MPAKIYFELINGENMDKYSRGYIVTHKNEISNGWNDEISFGMIGKHDNLGICTVRWIYLSGKKTTPLLEVFSDGWKALSLFTDVIQEMGKYDGKDIPPKKFIKILKSCGFKSCGELKDIGEIMEELITKQINEFTGWE
jgi:hypothetical protein